MEQVEKFGKEAGEVTRVELDINGMNINYDAINYSKLTKEQMKVIIDFDKYRKSKGHSESTRENSLFFLMQFARNVGKDFDKMTEDDITDFLSQDIKQTTRNWYIQIIKRVFKWLKKPELVEDLEQKQTDLPVEAKDLWTSDEILKLIETAHHPRDKCLVAMMFDLSIERKCIVEMNIEDIESNGTNIYVTVRGKRRGQITKRRNKCIDSAPYVIQWLNCHPHKNNPKAPFFISFSPNNYGKRVSNNYAYDTLKLLAERAGFKKPIRPHLIRHSALTDLYRKGLRGVYLQQYAGWTGPMMEQRYVSLAPEEIDDAREQIVNGKSPEPKELEKSKIKQVNCPRCKTVNPADAEYCTNCFIPLNQKVATNETLIVEFLRSALYQSDKSQLAEFDISMLAEKLNQLVKEQHKKGRKQVTA